MTEVETALAPVRKRVRVACDVEHAFRMFTDGIETWWPLRTHSISGGPDGEHAPERVVFEQGSGGRVYEIGHDGRQCNWATILVYEPPRRLVLEWKVTTGAPPTEVEVLFTPDDKGTIVELEHRGWERYAEDGDLARASYDSGWPGVLGLYEGAAEA